MDISLAMKNQILVDDIDLLQFTQNKQKQWLVSNFIFKVKNNGLCLTL